MTSATIALCGEWQPLTYDVNMYTKHYKYFMEPSNIYAYSSSTYLAYSGSSSDVDVSGGADFGLLASWPSTESMLTGVVKLGTFDLRVFYDQIEYGGTISQNIPINSTINDQITPISLTIPDNGYVKISYVSESYNWLTVCDITVFSAKCNGIEYYGDNLNIIKFKVNTGDTVDLYINSINKSDNNGIINVKYDFYKLP